MSDPSRSGSAGEATQLLRRLAQGEGNAAERLLPLLYEELRRAAAACMHGERADHTLQPTALVHEAWVRIAGAESPPIWSDRKHFLRIAARAMRRVLVDHARSHSARRPGGAGHKLPLDAVLVTCEEHAPRLAALDAALERLEQVDAGLARLVELRFFAGLTVPEAAGVLEQSLTTTERRWRMARIWLRRELELEA